LKTSIIGISAYYHDSSACLLVDGEIIAAAQEERFTRIKNDESFPVQAIIYCLKEANIKLSELDHVVFYEKPLLKFERILDTIISNAPLGFSFYLNSIPRWVKDKLFMKINIIKQLKKIDPLWNKSVFFSDHHLSHMGSAFYPSPFKKALILTIDGVGEWTTTAIGIGNKNNISIKETISYPHSIGLLYSAFTQYLGFKVNSGEYKVMGLAPYGKPIYADLITKNIVHVKKNGSYKLNMTYFSFSKKLSMINNNFINLFKNKTREPESEISQFHLDIAASIQKVIEDIVVSIVNYMSSKYNISSLTMAGGVALNCVANSKIIEETPIKQVWVQPASGDAGGSLGAALALHYTHLGIIRFIDKEDSMQGAYLGPSFNAKDIEKTINDNKLAFSKLNSADLISLISKEINNEKIIGWFQGRMEFGPRSLGNRAILGKANSTLTQKNLNLKIKFRESFRPFAPTVLLDKALDYFKPLGNTKNIDSPYMLFTYQLNNFLKINPEHELSMGLKRLTDKRSKIQAVTHVDYSSRVQTVSEKSNALFYALIKEVGNTSGYPIIVNTSFNVRGEPIVCTPQDAINCFLKTEMDILVLGNYIIKKGQVLMNTAI
jgi:carbamoyltransferase